MNIQPIRIDMVAVYDINTDNDKCLICKNPLILNCISCETNNKFSECLKCIGLCKHAYHKHCIEKSLKDNERCPKCKTDFVYDKKNIEPSDWLSIYNSKIKIKKYEDSNLESAMYDID